MKQRRRKEDVLLHACVCVPLLVARRVGTPDGGGLVDVDPVVGAATLFAVLGLPATTVGLRVRTDAGV